MARENDRKKTLLPVRPEPKKQREHLRQSYSVSRICESAPGALVVVDLGTIAVLCCSIFLGYRAMGSLEMHVNFTNVEVNQFRAEVIPMYQQRAHLDLPRYKTGKCVTCISLSFANKGIT